MTIKQKLSRTAARFAAIALMVLGVATLAVTPASAADPQTVRHPESGLCLDASLSQGVRLNACNGSDYQEWQVITTGYGSYIRNVAAQRCLDASVSQGVRLNTCENDYQKWYRTSETEYHDLKHVKSRLCLDGSRSQGVRLNTCNDSDYQEWRLF